jgi:glycosyltransferase involved in cell wall biosynthesis
MEDRSIKFIIISSFNNRGFLDDLNDNCKINVKYKYRYNFFFRFYEYFHFQFLTIIKIGKIKNVEFIYINTLEPFLVGLYSCLKKYKVFYHIHEAYPKLNFFKRFSFWLVYKTSEKIFCVSKFVLDSIDNKYQYKSILFRNSLRKAIEYSSRTLPINRARRILMISSPRAYKGVYHFCELSKLLKSINFILICSMDEYDRDLLFKEYLNLDNLEIHTEKSNIDEYYLSSDLILNLSDPRHIIETFGLTVLEAMYHGIPSIVPNVGGITELVVDGYNGFKISCLDIPMLVQKINYLLTEEESYNLFSINSIKMSQRFSFNQEFDKFYIEISRI